MALLQGFTVFRRLEVVLCLCELQDVLSEIRHCLFLICFVEFNDILQRLHPAVCSAKIGVECCTEFILKDEEFSISQSTDRFDEFNFDDIGPACAKDLDCITEEF